MRIPSNSCAEPKFQSGWQPAGGLAILREEELGDHPAHLVFAQALVLSGAAKE
jgi:hypothetical protein